jgi:CRP/FNR family transcriptional regulator, cyclic AMP receptor protein
LARSESGAIGKRRGPSQGEVPSTIPVSLSHVLEDDPDLHDRVPEQDRRRALTDVVARVETLDIGTWDEPDSPENTRDGFGLLVLDGLLARRVTLGRFDCTELLGQGDLLRPWSFAGAAAASVPSQVTWNVVEPVRLASLDRRFALAVAPWPELSAALMDRIVQRARWLAFQLAVCHVVRVDTRLLLMMWHFADRWGRMTKDGARVSLPVTHSVLASVVGARRPSVTTALGRLQDDGLIERLPDGAWLLHGSPPEDFAAIEAEAVAYPGSA